MGKEKDELDKEVTSGRFPPCILYKILYTGSEESRVKSALMMVDVDGANVPLVFSCRVKEEMCECRTVQVCMVQLGVIDGACELHFVITCICVTYYKCPLGCVQLPHPPGPSALDRQPQNYLWPKVGTRWSFIWAQCIFGIVTLGDTVYLLVCSNWCMLSVHGTSAVICMLCVALQWHSHSSAPN